jgi:hypothetical protein
MEALDTLAVADRDILARTPAPRRTRENRARSGDHGLRPRARLALPVRQEVVCGGGYRTFQVETACAT